MSAGNGFVGNVVAGIISATIGGILVVVWAHNHGMTGGDGRSVILSQYVSTAAPIQPGGDAPAPAPEAASVAAPETPASDGDAEPQTADLDPSDNVSATDRPGKPSEVVLKPAPLPEPQPAAAEMPAGTTLVLAADRDVCTRGSATFTASLQQTAWGSGGAQIPAGATLTLVATTGADDGTVRIEPRSLSLNGRSYELRGYASEAAFESR